MSEILDVTGGAGGVAASYAAARELADTFDAAGDRLRALVVEALSLMRDPDLLASGLLAPGSCAEAEAALLAYGTRTSAAALGWEADAVAVRVAIAGLEGADEAARLAVGVLDRQLVALAPRLLAVPLALDPDRLSDHPGLTEHLVSGLGGPLTAALAGLAYSGPGRAVVTPYPATLPADQPRTVRDPIEHLHVVADLSEGSGSPANGTVEVQTIRGADVSVRHVAYLPGTDDFNGPWDQDGDVRDLETDLDLAAGRPDAYVPGIREALHRAGVGPDEPVLLVGHSLGGMAAAALVADGGFRFTGAVTAGSPTAQVTGFPEGTHVLSLEQRGDVVPELDGAPNRDSVEQTTVRFDADPPRGVLGHHSYETYEQGAALVDASTDPSLVDVVGALEASGHLGSGGAVTSQLFQITRAP